MLQPLPDIQELARAAQQKFAAAYSAVHAHSLVVDVPMAFACNAAYKFRSVNGKARPNGLPFPTSMEFAAWQLLPLFNGGTSKDPDHIQKLITLLDELEQAHVSSEFLNSLADCSDDDEIESHVKIFSAYVRGSAYPRQIEVRLEACFAGIEKELHALTGTTPAKVKNLIRRLSFVLEDNLNRLSETITAAYAKVESSEADGIGEAQGELSNALQGLNGPWMPTWAQVSQDTSFNKADWTACRENIGMTVESRSQTKQLVDAQDRPVIFPSESQAFFASGTQALDAAFQWFDRLARERPELRDRYVRGVADWMEETIERFCLRLFPREAVIRSAAYPDPDHQNGEAEADCIVLWGPFLLIFEAKASRVDSSAVRADRKKLKKVISKNIQDAFAQAQRVIRGLESNGQLKFREKNTGRTLIAVQKNLSGVFPVSVTLQHLFGIPTQLAATQGLGLFKGNAYPWSVSIDDLETITRFVGWPDAFIHYVKRRTEHQKLDLSLSGDELDIFGHYLDNRLHPDIYENRPEILSHEGENHITFDGGEERFDKVYTSEWYSEVAPSENIAVKIPPSIRSILTELRVSDSDSARWIAFSLLGLSDQTLQAIGDTAEELRRTHCHPGKTIRRTAKDGDVVVNMIAGRGANPEQFKYDLLFRTRIEHYRRRPRASITIGIDQLSQEVFEHAIWFEGDGGIEPAMERILQQERQRPRIVKVSGRNKIPGRNNSCPCGSGNKFKHCCIDSIRFEV